MSSMAAESNSSSKILWPSTCCKYSFLRNSISPFWFVTSWVVMSQASPVPDLQVSLPREAIESVVASAICLGDIPYHVAYEQIGRVFGANPWFATLARPGCHLEDFSS